MWLVLSRSKVLNLDKVISIEFFVYQDKKQLEEIRFHYINEKVYKIYFNNRFLSYNQFSALPEAIVNCAEKFYQNGLQVITLDDVVDFMIEEMEINGDYHIGAMASLFDEDIE